MGQTQAHLKARLTSQRRSVRCLPRRPYTPFPGHLHPTGSGGLVLQVKIIDSLTDRCKMVPPHAFWWVDAQFLPYNDAVLVVSTTPYNPRLFHTWFPIKTFFNGRIVLYDTRHNPVKVSVLTGTENPMYPKVQVHPTGEAVAYAGKAELRVDTMTGEMVYSKPRELDNRSHRFCALSPNGMDIAVLTHSQRTFYIEILKIGMFVVSHRRPMPCSELCAGFEATGAHNDHVECKWSPDGSHLGISSSSGQFFVVDKDLDRSISVMVHMGQDQTLSTAGSFDFDPTARYSVMAVGTSVGTLIICQVSTCPTEGNSGVTVLQHADLQDTITCVQYNHDGSSVAVGFHSFKVMIFSRNGLCQLQTFDLSVQCPAHVSQYQSQSYPTVQRLSFSYDGRYLATASCDGCVRVWAVSSMLTLQEWCRRTVLQTLPVVHIRTSSLPAKLKKFLLSDYF